MKEEEEMVSWEPGTAGDMERAGAPKATIITVAMKKCIKITHLRKGSGNSYPAFFFLMRSEFFWWFS